jgi:hypothetical protein
MQNLTSGLGGGLEHPTGSKKKFNIPMEHPMMHIVRFFWNKLLLIFQNEILASNLRALAKFINSPNSPCKFAKF